MSDYKVLPPVRAVAVERMKDAKNIPGAFRFISGYQGIVFMCPCGCKAVVHLNFANFGYSGPVWSWDGNTLAPTLAPSIHWHDHWHGWLRNGEFVSIG